MVIIKAQRKSLRRKVASFFSIFVTGLLCLLAIIYSSPWGTQAGIALINKSTEITLTYESGMFSKHIKFSDFLYDNEHVTVFAKNLSLKLHLRCLWQKQLCIDELAAEHLSIRTQPTNNINEVTEKLENKPNSKQNFSFEFPFSIKATNVSIQKIELILAEYALKFDKLNSPITIKKRTLTFDEPTIKNIDIVSIKNKALEKQLPQIIQLPKLKLPITVKVTNLALDTLSNQTDLLTDYLPKKFNKLHLSANWFAHDLYIQNFTSNYVTGLADINGKISFIDNYPLDIQFQNKMLNYTSWPEINNSTQTSYLKGDLAHLSLTIKSIGKVEFESTGEINALNRDFPYTFDLQATKIPLYNQLSEILHPSMLSLASHGNKYKQNVLANSVVNGLGYKNAKTSFKASYNREIKSTTLSKIAAKKHSYNKETKQFSSLFNYQFNSEFNHHLNIEHFTLNDTNNNLNIAGSIKLEKKPSWNLNIYSTGFTFPKFKHGNNVNPEFKEWLSGRVKGRLNTTGIYNKEHSAITLTNTQIEGLINQVPFLLSGEMYLNENLQLKPSSLILSVYDTAITIKGFSDSQWHINGSIEAPKISKYYPAANGQLLTKFNITGELEQPKIHFKNNIKNFSFKKIVAPSISIQGNYSPFNRHLIQAQIKSKKVSWLNTDLTHFIAKINADINQQALDIKWDGNFKSKLLLNSHWNETTKNWTGIIAEAELSYLTHSWLPNNDIILEYNHNTTDISINKHCWNNPGLQLCLPKKVSFFKYGKIPLALNFNSSYFNQTFAPTDILVNTNIKGNGEVNWSPNEHWVAEGSLAVLAGNVLLEEKQINLPVKVLSAWDEGRLNFKINDLFADVQLTLGPETQSNINQQYDFYSNISIKGYIDFTDNNSTMNYPLLAEVDINNFNLRPLQAINHELTLLEGVLSTKTKISGSLNQPVIKGEANLTKGRFKLLKSPNILNDVQVKVALSGKKAELEGTFNIDKDLAYIKGDASWKKEKTLNLTVNAEKLSILFPPQIEATVSPQLQAVLTKNNLKISGEINVLDGIIRVTKLPEGSVELTNDVIFVDTKGNEIVKENHFNIESDIKVFINDAFQLTGQGFNGNLEGALRIQHNTSQPIQLFGNLNIPDGRYHAYGQRLQVEKGKVAFNGPLENPHIDLRATRTIPKENIKVGVEINGLANALSLKLISSPTMSRAQTLSYLLRGQGLENDSPDNSGIGVALGAALANYSGFLKQIDKLPLVNNVEIEGDSSQVSIAGYLGKRIYIKYGIGVDDPVNELTIRLFLMSRLWVETISGLENSADIYYSFDTDF